MKKKKKSRQETLWIPHDAVASSPGHPFYEELERVLREEEFDSFVESKCSPYYAKKQGRPSIPPGVYFRMLLIGYFERIDSERGICCRCSDSLSFGTCQQLWDTRELHLVSLDYGGETREVGAIDVNIDQDLVA